ncbi:FGGY family carbohydrate kinase [Georgenia sp. M64]|uniref:FGGY family carbohydrate kinase n=1 Tax=Georgenia sp. M64 TaxID=3120520 RepID=UPI0030E4DFE8
MAVPAYLALDEGTTNTKALLVDLTGRVVAAASAAVELVNPAPAHFEQDAEQIWSATEQAITRCLAQAVDVEPVALVISNQRESVVAWSRATGRALGPVVGWQDGRTAESCARIATPETSALVAARTGLHLDPMYSATKMAWLYSSVIDGGHDPADVVVGTVDAFLVSRLTGGATVRCDATNASRTLLYNLHDLAWDEELCDLFGVPLAALPEVERSDGDFGVTVAGGAVPAGLPVAGVLGDSHAALYGQECHRPGLGKVTYGTGSSVMVPTPRSAPAHGTTVDTTLAWLSDKPLYAREGNVLATGAALETMGSILGLPSGGSALAALAASADSSGGVQVVPAFSGLAAPHWDRSAVGVVTGVRRDTGAAHVARATVESMAHQVSDIVEEIERSGDAVEALRADGGASVNPFVMQVQADLIGKPVHVAGTAELSAVGVAKLAIRAAGGGAGLDANPTSYTVYEPQLPADRRIEARAQWREALDRSGGRAVRRAHRGEEYA